jgi:hypothetical protein
MKRRVLTWVFDEEHELRAMREILIHSNPRTPYANAMREELLRSLDYKGPNSGEQPFPVPQGREL